VRTVSVRYIANVKEYVSSVKEMAKTTRDFRTELAETAAKGQGDLDAVANGAIAFGLALGGVFAAGIAQAAEFEHSMAQVNAVSNATESEFQSLRQAALEMGATTQFSATEAADAIQELSKAGLTAAQITGGALTGALNLAAAGGIGLAEAASIASTTLKQFNLEASQMSMVADTLAGSANASNTDVAGLGQSLGNVGTVAAQAGLTVEETIGILSALGDQAITGAEAGTALKTTLLRLLAPTAEAKTLMDQLGISVYDAKGQALSAVEIIRELEAGFAGMSVEQRNAAMATLFGQEAIAGANVLMAEGSRGIQSYIDKVSEQGVAAETAAKRIDSLKGDVGNLQSAIEGLAIESSGGLSDALRTVTRFGTELVGTLNLIPGPVANTVVVLGTIAAVSSLVGGTFIRMRDSAAQMNQQLRNAGPASQAVATGFSAISRYGGPAIGILGGLQAASLLLSATIGSNLNPQIEAFGNGLARWAEDGEVAGEIARIMGKDMDKFGQSLESAADTGGTRFTAALVEGLVPASKEFDDSLAKSTERIAAMDTALAQLQASDPEAAAEAWAKISEEADKQGISTQRLTEIFPEYQAALENASAATEAATEPISAVALETEILANAFNLTGESAQESLTAMLDAWSEGATRFIDLLGAYEAALGELDEGQKLTSQSFIDSLRQQVEAQEAWAANMEYLAARVPPAMLDELARMGPEGAEMVELMKNMTDAELQEVIQLWGRRGDQVGDEIADGILNGTDAAQTGLFNLQDVIDGLHGKNVTITVDLLNNIAASQFNNAKEIRRWGGITTHARTGLLREAGVYSTNQPALYAFAEPATHGEAFIPKRGNRARSLAILDQAAAWYGAELITGTQWRGQRPVPVASTAGLPESGAPGRGRQYGATVVERQEVTVVAHTDTFSYRQVMDEMSWHGAV
jgi:TP901 family phage tail tape measure protein